MVDPLLLSTMQQIYKLKLFRQDRVLVLTLCFSMSHVAQGQKRAGTSKIVLMDGARTVLIKARYFI